MVTANPPSRVCLLPLTRSMRITMSTNQLSFFDQYSVIQLNTPRRNKTQHQSTRPFWTLCAGQQQAAAV
jgi:hypothetical protein